MKQRPSKAYITIESSPWSFSKISFASAGDSSMARKSRDHGDNPLEKNGKKLLDLIPQFFRFSEKIQFTPYLFQISHEIPIKS